MLPGVVRCLLLTLFALLRVEGLPLLVLLLLLQLLQLLRLLLAEFRNRMRLQRRSGLCPIVMGCLLLQRVRAYLRQMLFLRLSVLLLPLLAFLRGIGRLAAGLHIERVLVGGEASEVSVSAEPSEDAARRPPAAWARPNAVVPAPPAAPGECPRCW